MKFDFRSTYGNLCGFIYSWVYTRRFPSGVLGACPNQAAKLSPKWNFPDGFYPSF